MPVEIRSLLRTEAETRALGRYLGTILRSGDWVALRGELGAGKTTLVAGIVEGIHPGARGRSPTYVLVEVYGEGPRIVHADLYRLGTPEEYETLALDDLAAGDAVVLIEWADRAEDRLPDERLDVSLRYLPSEYGPGREIRLTPRGDRWDDAAREGLLDRERWQDALHPGN
ncbi:MAG TPA: tRNA (adenosine(37)-N6)-threonylcarbamoyltransferase complex ATPase subunit type 1 TsaE [Acidobacteriota bacterium]|nr:tRNA (adenosine(37)-N6)-threonylcarbamoyltransferase complex ATPase subunit type 1 TsaE [Acidobacteriota bacterium]